MLNLLDFVSGLDSKAADHRFQDEKSIQNAILFLESHFVFGVISF